MSYGILYCMYNPKLPGFLKIGTIVPSTVMTVHGPRYESATESFKKVNDCGNWIHVMSKWIPNPIRTGFNLYDLLQADHVFDVEHGVFFVSIEKVRGLFLLIGGLWDVNNQRLKALETDTCTF